MRFARVAISLTLSRLLVGCVADQATPTSVDEPWPPEGMCPAPAGKFTLYAIAPPIAFDWSSPNALIRSVQASRAAGDQLVASGAAKMKRSIGHINLELECGADSIALTGQTGGGPEWVAATDGAGLLLRDTPGAMDDMPTGDPIDMVADIATRKASGKVTMISFVVNQKTCRRLREFMTEYVSRDAHLHYNGAFRARRMEGAGCAIFGAGMVDVAGLLRRSLFTPPWSRSVMIGSARIADFLGDGGYDYGGNLVAMTPDGAHWLWPKGQRVPASASTPVWIFSDVLDAWAGPEDGEFDVPGVYGEMRTKVPFSIYDPELMAAWGEQIWHEADRAGSAQALGATWTASTVGAAHEVTYDASCARPQSIPFAQDHDDLFEDSDADVP